MLLLLAVVDARFQVLSFRWEEHHLTFNTIFVASDDVLGLVFLILLDFFRLLANLFLFVLLCFVDVKKLFQVIIVFDIFESSLEHDLSFFYHDYSID